MLRLDRHGMLQLDRHELRPPEVAWCIPEEHRFKASGTQHAVRLPESDAARRPEHIFTLKPDHNTRFVPVKPSRSVRRAYVEGTSGESEGNPTVDPQTRSITALQSTADAVVRGSSPMLLDPVPLQDIHNVGLNCPT